MEGLVHVANEAVRALHVDDGVAFVGCLRRTARALARLGDAAQVGIVPDGFDALEAIAIGEGASFSVSGAGGGDVAVFLGGAPPSARFIERAEALGLTLLDLDLDTRGVRIDFESSSTLGVDGLPTPGPRGFAT
jgi:phosphomevalonate kinase